RMFRMDRMKSVAMLEEPSSVPDSFEPEEYRGAFRAEPDEPVIRFEISPRAARWFSDYYPVVNEEAVEDGWHRIEMAVSGEHWAATLALQLGTEIRAIEPEQINERAADLARVLTESHS
ncbi:MAG TPA: WYL domain-containing protein, partial [Actinomycetota bacterium]|nr:WYL domain-containing protein [Actinomycetota bacterium]